MILLTYWAGMRVGEVANLKLGDVIAADGTVKPEICLNPNQTKGNKGRVVIIPLRLQDEIKSYLSQAKEENRSEPLFRSQKSPKGFSPCSLSSLFKELYNLAGLENGSSHSGRRTFITNLASRGVSARVLQELAGHRHLSTTQRYIDINDEMKRNAVELI